MPITHSGRELRTDSAVLSNSKSANANAKRSGDILDGLVFMLAGMLLPAWLLGMLYLTFYPASDTAGEMAAGNSDIAAVSNSDTETGENEQASSSNSGNPGASGSDTKPNNEFKLKLDSMTEKFQSLTTTSEAFESEVMSLKQTNATLVDENAALKTQMAQAASMAQATPDLDNSAAMNELQTKYDSTALQLESTKQNLADATTRLQSTENEKRTLQNDLATTQSQLEQANTNLAAAISKAQASMESRPAAGSSESPFALLHSDQDTPKPDMAAEANAKVVELEQQIKELSFNLNNANEAMDANKEELQIAKQELQAAQTQMQTLQAQNGDLQTALKAARESVTKPEVPKEVFRDYVSSKGSVSKMAFIRWEGESVIVRSFANKKLYRLTMDRFSEADQKYLLEQK